MRIAELDHFHAMKTFWDKRIADDFMLGFQPFRLQIMGIIVTANT
jgi:hypothetical protein